MVFVLIFGKNYILRTIFINLKIQTCQKKHFKIKFWFLGCRSLVQNQGSSLSDRMVPRSFDPSRGLRRSQADRAQGHHGAGVLLVDQSGLPRSVDSVGNPREIRREFGDQLARFSHRRKIPGNVCSFDLVSLKLLLIHEPKGIEKWVLRLRRLFTFSISHSIWFPLSKNDLSTFFTNS